MSEQEEKDKNGPKKSKFNYYWIYGLFILVVLGIQFIPGMTTPGEEINETAFFNNYLKQGKVEKINIVNKDFVEVYLNEKALASETDEAATSAKGPHKKFTILSMDGFRNDLNGQLEANPQNAVKVEMVDRTDWRGGFLSYLLPLIIIVLIWLFIMRRVSGSMGGAGGQIFNIGKSKATLFDKDTSVSVTFNDVAGLEEAKEEVVEIVDFLKHPSKYTALGGKIPKGALLVGPPGTGKTLMAKAMAGEAKVPFFSISGSDFVEMFVGVGASRVRDLFKQAREKAPCIIFIDEIDAIGRARGKGMVQGNDERENTLNQLLVEMDGFSSKKGIIMIAATNRPDVLDSALLRPGRFDRQIVIDRPDIKGREAIFKVHIKPLKVVDDIDIWKLAAQTPGFVGADVANVCNEAALIAARKGKKAITDKDFQDAIDRHIGGLERKSRIISPDEREIIAYHEAGHAICGWYLEHADPLLKVTIVPRGMAGGYAQYIPKERFLYNADELNDQMCMLLGGRVAEDIIFGKVSTGAQNDLERITQMAYGMVSVYGMSEKVGNVSFNDTNGEYNFKKPYSEETSKMIDEEVRSMIKLAYAKTKDLLKDKQSELEMIAKELLKTEILFKSDLERLIGIRPSEMPPQERAAGIGSPKAQTDVDEDIQTNKG